MLGVILALGSGVRLLALDQPLVENYVGRQIPSAMVARNLMRGSGFLNPVLDVAPFPNRFLVEPPVHAWLAAALSTATAWPLGVCGRLVSTLAITLGAWGLHGLVLRRSGRTAALVATLAFLAFPLTIRYGRAFQPDAAMLGCLLAGLRLWEGRPRADARGGPNRSLGFVLLSLGLALKVLSAWVLIPFLLLGHPRRRPRRVACAVLLLLPAALWYGHAAGMLSDRGGSRASMDNAAIWLSVLDPSRLVRAGIPGHLARFLGWRSFTPLGPPLALIGLFHFSTSDRFWRAWGLSAIVALSAVAGKLHHEYYLLALAPVVAAGIGQSIAGMAQKGVAGAVVATACASVLLGLCGLQARGTFETPQEWAGISRAASILEARVPRDEWVVAPEALLFQADRRGCRLERSADAARRAAGEWPSRRPAEVASPLELVEFYRQRGARWFADLPVVPGEARASRVALHDALRRRYKCTWEDDSLLLLELSPAD